MTYYLVVYKLILDQMFRYQKEEDLLALVLLLLFIFILLISRKMFCIIINI